MIRKTTIAGAVALNILFIILGISVSPYFFIVLGINILLIIIPMLYRYFDDNYSLDFKYNIRESRAKKILKKCEMENENKEVILEGMRQIIKLHITFYGVDEIMAVTSVKLRNDREFILEALKIAPILNQRIGSKLKKDTEFMNTVKELKKQSKH